jgi:uncharacterized membrane protein YjgN (DUF898 family)
MMLVSGLALLYLFYAHTVNALALAGHAFRFEGDAAVYGKANLRWLLLTVVTAGLYGAWYARHYVAFFVERTQYRGRSFGFGSRPRRLFAIVALTLVLPLGGFTAVWALFPHLFPAGGGLAATYGVLLYLLGVPFSYLVLKWTVDLRWHGSRIYVHTEFPAAIAQILLQHVLTVAMAGIYLPAAAVPLYRYFVERTAIVGPGVAKRVGFDGSILRGFGTLWGQLALSVLTAGVYAPWAYARIVRWLARYTFLEPE